MIKIILSYIEEKAFFKASKDIRNELENQNVNKIFFLVPEQFTVEAERMLTDKLSAKGLIDIEVLSIKRLTNRILSKTRSEMPPVLDDSGKSMIIKVILNKLKNELTCFKSLTNKASFNENLSELFSELKKSNVASEDLNPDNFNNKNEEDYFYKKSLDIHKIYKAYNDFLSDDFIDFDDITLYASSVLDNVRFLDNTGIYYFGFEGFDRNVYSLIEAISKKNINQTFLFTTNTKEDTNNESYRIIDDTLYKLKKLAENNDEEVVTEIDKEDEKEKDIKFLADNIFSYDTKTFDDEINNIEIFKASTIYEEVEMTALNILKLIKEENADFKDIQVLPSDYDTYKEIISETFKKHNISFFLDNTTSIMDTNILRGILKILNIVEGNFKTHDIISFLKTGLTDLSKTDIETFENYALEFGIKGTMWTADFKRNNPDNEYDLAYLNEKKDELMLPLITLRNDLKDKTSVKEITNIFYDFLEEFGLYEKIITLVNKFKYKEDFENANKYAQIHNSIITALEQIYDFLGNEELSLSEYTKVLESGFNALKIGIIPSTIDSVNIASLSRSRSSEIKYLFILGVNDGVLPSNFSNSGGIFSNKEKLKAINEGINLRTTEQYKIDEERYFLTSVILKTEKKIFLSYPITGSNGDELLPSSIIFKIQDTMPKLKVKALDKNNFEDNLSLISNYEATFKYLLNNKLHKNSSYKVNTLWDTLYDLYKKDDKGKYLIDIMNSALSFNNKAVIQNKKLVDEIYKGEIVTSISRLETYAKCPFSYFVSYALKPKERKKNEINKPDIGNILHEIISEFSRKIIEKEIDTENIEKHEIEKISFDITNDIIDKYSSGKLKNIINSAYFKSKLIRNANYSLSTIVSELNRSNFKITSTESKFSEENEEAIKIVTNKNNLMTIHGIIDRVDSYEDENGSYVKVIDYKTGNATFDFIKSYYGISMQLPIYLTAATNNEDKKPAGAFYFKITPPIENIKSSSSLKEIKEAVKENKLDGVVLDDKELMDKIDNNKNSIKVNRDKTNMLSSKDFSNLIIHTKNKAKEIIDDIAEGKIEIHPYIDKNNSTPCEWCKYNNICKFDTCFKDNNYNKLSNLPNKEIKELLSKEAENELD
ncbi:PD-(D/E)XK nuclease family protein [Anaerofustis stercorihominis]|uniref:PD-(D/E)XK nuclease family protein n=1 Tax=Anaerofustis stercorihominis TaxID=214853 RepID=UPI003991463A